MVEKCEDGGIISFVQHSDGSRGHVLSCGSRQLNNPYYQESSQRNYVQMDGREVFAFAVRQVPAAIKEALDKANLTPQDVDRYVLHQANRRIIEGISKRLGFDMAGEEAKRFPMNLNRVGNTSSAAIPLLLDELNQRGELKEGQTLVLSGFGAGLTYGACVMKW